MFMIPSEMDTLSSATAPPPSADLAKRLLLWLVAVAFFMESLVTTILNTAVPTIAAALRVSPLSMKSILASYSLGLAVFIPNSGWMADCFGTRRVFSSAIGLFMLGSLLSGLSSDIRVLVACRSGFFLAHGSNPRWHRRLASVLAMFAGAALGVIFVRRSVFTALAFAIVVASVCSVALLSPFRLSSQV